MLLLRIIRNKTLCSKCVVLQRDPHRRSYPRFVPLRIYFCWPSERKGLVRCKRFTWCARLHRSVRHLHVARHWVSLFPWTSCHQRQPDSIVGFAGLNLEAREISQMAALMVGMMRNNRDYQEAGQRAPAARHAEHTTKCFQNTNDTMRCSRANLMMKLQAKSKFQKTNENPSHF